MQLVSNCPLRAGLLKWQARPWQSAMTVVVKATFRLAQTTCPLADAQEDPNEHELHWDDDPQRSLHAPSDLVPFKAGAEITLVGHAFAPRGDAVPRLVARMLVGAVDKSIVVHGERWFGQDGALRTGARFHRMPLRYERAAGGPETKNPVGVARAMSSLGAVPVPNLEPLGTNVATADDIVEPIGFAPIAEAWPTRRERLGRSRRPWSFASEPVPEWFDRRYFMSAPPDQHLDELRVNERIVLENLHPEHPRLVTSLPGIRPRALVEQPGAPVAELPLVCDTLWIDTDRAICTLTWRGQLALADHDARGRVMIAMEVPGKPFSWSASSAPAVRDIHQTQPAVPLDPSTVMPFARTSSPSWTRSADAPSVVEAVVAPVDMPSSIAPIEAPVFGPAPAITVGQHVALELPVVARSIIVPSPSSVRASPARSEAHDRDAREPSRIATAALRDAAAQGAAAASDAAAATVDREAPRPASPAQPAARASGPRDLVDLLWYDRDAAARILAYEGFASALPQRQCATWIAGDAGLREPPEAKTRRELSAVLAHGVALDEAALGAVADEAYDHESTFAPPLALVAGELAFAFDEIETLRATLTVVAPLAASDKRLKETLAAAAELLKSEWGVTGDAAEGMTRRIEEAFAQGQRTVAPDYLDANVEKILLHGRCYQKRNLFGEPCIRALFAFAPDDAPIPAYLAELAGQRLPLFRRFRMKAVVELRPQEDQHEAHPDALRVLALARLVHKREVAR